MADLHAYYMQCIYHRKMFSVTFTLKPRVFFVDGDLKEIVRC